MNKARRKQLSSLSEQLGVLLIELKEIKTAEEEAFYYLPIPLQKSETGERMNEIISSLNSVYSFLEEAISGVGLAQE